MPLLPARCCVHCCFLLADDCVPAAWLQVEQDAVDLEGADSPGFATAEALKALLIKKGIITPEVGAEVCGWVRGSVGAGEGVGGWVRGGVDTWSKA